MTSIYCNRCGVPMPLPNSGTHLHVYHDEHRNKSYSLTVAVSEINDPKPADFHICEPCVLFLVGVALAQKAKQDEAATENK